MIRVKFLGGARKSFSTDAVTLEHDEIVLEGLLSEILAGKPGGTPDLDTRNILVAVNGVDSSAMDGKNTVIRSGDTVSIIPVIHGGAQHSFVVGRTCVSVLPVSGRKTLDYRFLDSLRARHPGAAIQAVSSRFILNASHVRKIVAVSLESKRRGILLSERLETDMLLRFAATTQISRAINVLGIRPGRDFVVIAAGPKRDLERIKRELVPLAGFGLASRQNAGHIKRHFKITERRLGAVSSRTPLEDILQEQASVLF